MLLEARETGVLSPVLAIVAGMSIQDVRERPEDRRETGRVGSSAFRRLCRAEFLNYVRVREWVDVHRQLRSLLRGSAPSVVERAKRDEPPGAAAAADPDAVHRAILAGLLSQIGVLDERARAKAAAGKPAPGEYLGARGARFAVFPGSGLKKKRPAAVMAAELVETSRLFARTVAAVDPAWAEPLAGDLAKRQLSDPHWSKDAGAAVAAEKVTLFGVEIIPRRRVQLARFDQALARELFLRHALRRRLEKIEERERRRDILVGDESVFAFYDARIPSDVFDARSFEAWWKDASARTPRLLDLTEADLLDEGARRDERDFPARWRQGDQVLSLAYRFEPGAPDDGVSVVVPLALLAQLRPDGFDWQVPGLRDELVTSLLRALPKAIRRSVVPAADWAATFAADLAGRGPEAHDGLPERRLVDELARLVQRVANQPVTAADFELERVPAHLRVTFRAVDERGRTLAGDADLAALQQRLAGRARTTVERSLQRGTAASAQAAGRVAAAGGSDAPSGAAASLVRSGLVDWSFDDLPEVVDTKVAGGVVRGYPAIVDEGASVSVRIEATPEDAARHLRTGVRRLLLLAVPSPAPYVLEHLTAAEKLALAASPYTSAKALIEDARVAVADAVLARETPEGIIRTRAEFTRVREALSTVIVDELFAAVSLCARIVSLSRDAERALKEQNSLTLLGALNDVRGQLGGCSPPASSLARA
ncbi:hypothetical protein LUZ63_021639 [Rhynchospora breviuscula]|uniref:ATP-dependent helicase n=1 Tax=Rhynchospora breviuscula TaxID=2022672 RepID=A0A9P9Z7R4_9POAL|nr:hypothetical protein LUZ63_021639 [Rhynchospora breviuscula]